MNTVPSANSASAELPAAPDELKRVLEAVLLSAREPLSLPELRKVFNDEITADVLRPLLEELRSASLDEPSRSQLRDIYERSIAQLETALSPELAAELSELSFDFPEGTVPSEVELRMAQSQLVGWLEGLFHGIQAALVAQQMSARQQLDGMRGQLMQGPNGPQPAPGPGPGYI